MSTKLHLLFAFLSGLAASFLIPTNRATSYTAVKSSVFHIDTLPKVGLSHNPEINKQVISSYLQLPHITQIAKSSIQPGQVASENWHRDMAEAFIFTSGSGMLNIDGSNFSVTPGTIALIFPPAKHTVFNTHSTQPLQLYTVASIP